VLNDILQVGEYYQVEIRVTGDAVTVPAGVGIFPVGLTLAEGVHKFNGKAVSTGVRLDANGDSTVHYFVRPTSNFLVNPNFNGGATGKFWGWIDQSFGTQTIDDTNNSINGQLTMTRTANDSEAIGQAVTVKANTDYVFTWRADNVTGAGYAQIYIGTTQNGYQLYQGLRDTSVEPGDWSTRSTTFNTGDTTTIYITVRTGNDVTFDLTHLSLRQAVVNRSKYSYTAGLQVHGQVRQEPVVTGSNLTCYTGFRDGFDSLFGSANGLVLPNLRNTHNNDFYVSCWIQGGSSAQVIMCYEHEAADSGGSWLLFQNSGRFHIYLRNNDTSVLNGEWKSWSSTDYGGSIYDSANLDAWNHLVYTRSGDSIKLYVNGILDIAADNIENFDIINHDSKICIGRRGGEFALDQKFAGKIALPKYGTHTIPQDKVYKMYSDEREMFYPNASVTIGSTPVYDVSYNEHDESLNVVTQNSTDKLQNLVVVSTTKTTGQKQINSQAEHTITG
jgi:hypothetical protein